MVGIFFSVSVNGITTSSLSAYTISTDAFNRAYMDQVASKIDRLGLQRTSMVKTGKASWYGGYFHGRTTATMEIFNKNLLSAAHKTLPLNTYLLVTNLENGRQVIVRINDRGPYIAGRDVDLSEAAAKVIGSHKQGVAEISYEILTKKRSKTA
jgi:rare lipoprotein A